MSLITNDKPKDTNWVTTVWRHAMGWVYMTICIFDFVLAPVLWSIVQAIYHGNITDQWDPLTLQGAGLFHLAMGAILGVTSWTRGQEKTALANRRSSDALPDTDKEDADQTVVKRSKPYKYERMYNVK